MLRQIILQKKLDQARKSLTAITEKETQFRTRGTELESAIREAQSDEEIAAVEEKVIALEEEKEELLDEKGKIETEIEAVEEELENYNSKKPDNTKRGVGMDGRGKVDPEVRTGIANYVRSKGHERAGFTSVEGGALIPEELIKPEKSLEDNVIDLSKIVRTVQVNSGAGKYPVIKKSGSKMISVAELVANPELAKPTMTEVAYDIQTYRGYIPVSQEVIDDADYDVTGLIAEEISDQELNTKNTAIAAILKTAAAKAVVGFDGLKKVFNVDLKKVYNAKAVITSSLFNELDITKDSNGRYLLQDDVTVQSGKKLFGHEVVVLDDDVIGTLAGDLKGFIGDPKEFAILFDRKKSSVKWTDDQIYGQLLAGYIRFDTKKSDTDAGFYITYTPAGPVV